MAYTGKFSRTNALWKCTMKKITNQVIPRNVKTISFLMNR